MFLFRRHGLLIAIVFLAVIRLYAVSKPPDPPLNVVVITIDTLRADHLGCYGYKEIRTPNIDRLAQEGTRFERAYTPVPITFPIALSAPEPRFSEKAEMLESPCPVT